MFRRALILVAARRCSPSAMWRRRSLSARPRRRSSAEEAPDADGPAVRRWRRRAAARGAGRDDSPRRQRCRRCRKSRRSTRRRPRRGSRCSATRWRSMSPRRSSGIYADDPNLVVINQGVGSSGFVRPDFFDWNKTATEQVTANSFDIAIMIIGINDRQTLKAGRRVAEGADARMERGLSGAHRQLRECGARRQQAADLDRPAADVEVRLFERDGPDQRHPAARGVRRRRGVPRYLRPLRGRGRQVLDRRVPISTATACACARTTASISARRAPIKWRSI